MEKKLKKALGNYVTGDKFWNRQNETELLAEKLGEGANILLTAQRRMGKTSLIREVGNRLRGRYICLQVDLQACETIADAIAEISVAVKPHQSLWTNTKGIFRNIVDTTFEKLDSLEVADLKVTLRSGMTAETWKNKGDALIKVLSECETPVVLFLDEIPILVNRLLKGQDYIITPERKQKVDTFMSWIREQTIQYKGKVRFVLTGSIGLEPVLQQAGLSATLNTFTPFELNPWDEDTAKECLQALGNEYGLSFLEEALLELIRKLGCCIPHYVQLFFDSIHDYCRRLRKQTEVSVEMVQIVYEKRMLSTRGHAELSSLEERLKMVLGQKHLPLALDLLTEGAITGKITSETAMILAKSYEFEDMSHGEALKEIFGILQHDGYLQKKDGEYRYVSHLLKDWWKARFEFGFIPASQRGN